MILELPKKTLLLLSGIPASGKTTALYNNVKLGSIKKEWIISADEVREHIGGVKMIHTPNGLKKQRDMSINTTRMVYDYIYRDIEQRMKNSDNYIIVDTMSHKKSFRDTFRLIASLGGYKVKIVAFKPNLELSLKRNQKRDVAISSEYIKQIYNEFELPKESDSIIISYEEELKIKTID
jgi:tRNA uridine 5-carbamoylmethylation protein Kti12